MSDGLLISRREFLEFLFIPVVSNLYGSPLEQHWQLTHTLDHGHLILVGGFPTFEVGSVSVAVLAVEVLRKRLVIMVVRVGVGGFELGDRSVESGDMFFEVGSNGLVGQV